MTVQALTTLTEDEKMFQEAVYSFARDRVGPLVSKMDEEAQIEQSLIPEHLRWV